MPLTATPTADAPGLTKGKAYPVLGFTGSTVLIFNDDKKVLHVPYVALNDKDLWSLSDDSKEEAAAPAPAAPAAPAPAAPVEAEAQTKP